MSEKVKLMSEEIKLSILVPYIKRHEALFTHLKFELYAQMLPYAGQIELLWDDHETDATGTKRNRLLERATGKYVVWFDADDYPFPCYVSEIMNGIESDCDCLAISGIITVDGANEMVWRISKDYPNETVDENGKQVYIRKTNHIAPVKRGLALMARFPDIGNGEDKEYSERLNPWLKTEHKVDHLLYIYRYVNGPKEYLKY